MMYKWKISVFKTDAEVAAKELERISEAHGGVLKPEYVVDESRHPEAPLHNEFEWNDEVAAEKYRVTQAQHIIRSIVIVDDTDQKPFRMFVNVLPKDSPETAYMRINDVLADSYLREQMLENARRELDAFKIKYSRVLELAELRQLALEVLGELQLVEK